MKAIEHYFWELDRLLADTPLFRRNQVVRAVHQCVREAEEMMIPGKPIQECNKTEIDEIFGAVDYVCYVAEANYQELQRWGKILTTLNAYVPEQKQGYWLAIGAIYYMDRELPHLAAKKEVEKKPWEARDLRLTGHFKQDLITQYLPSTFAVLSMFSLFIPFLGFIPGALALGWGIWMLSRDIEPAWLATSSIAAGFLALFISIVTIISLIF